MNAQLRKEFRSLVWPALLIAVCALVTLLNQNRASSDFWSFLVGFAQFGFFAGIAFLAAMAFGSEFQQRTFVLLLSQPVERFRIWRDKMLALAAIVPALAIIGVIYCARRKSAGLLSENDLLVTVGALGVVIIAICSTVFWTLAARSTIGGVVFSATIMFAIGGAVQAIAEKVIKAKIVSPILIMAALIFIALLYSVGCLWLGWRTFANLELRDTFAGEAISLPKYFPGAKWFGNLLRPRPTGSLRNLIRKELRLQKTILLLAVIFTVGWLLMLGWCLLFPEHIDKRDAFTALSVIYLLILAMLIGPASFDEEKTLGLAAWHLTLPPSARRQWFVKFGVAASVCVVLGIFLPSVLSLTAIGEAEVSKHGQDFVWVPIFGFLFVLSFWAASLTGNMVRGVLTTVFTCFALGASAALAGWLAEQLGGLQRSLLEFLTVKLHWSPSQLSRLADNNQFAAVCAIGAVVLFVALLQSIRCFRRTQTHEGIPLRRPLILVLSAFLILIWAFDFRISSDKCEESIRSEFGNTFSSDVNLWGLGFPPPGQTQKITLQELERNNPISSRMHTFLEGVTIELIWEYSAKKERYAWRYVEFRFPGGETIDLNPTWKNLNQPQQQEKK